MNSISKLIVNNCSFPRCQYLDKNIFKQKEIFKCCGWNKELSNCEIGVWRPFPTMKQWKCCDDNGKFICNCPIVTKLKNNKNNKNLD